MEEEEGEEKQMLKNNTSQSQSDTNIKRAEAGYSPGLDVLSFQLVPFETPPGLFLTPDISVTQTK